MERNPELNRKLKSFGAKLKQIINKNITVQTATQNYKSNYKLIKYIRNWLTASSANSITEKTLTQTQVNIKILIFL